ncbi:MAG: Na+/H+ antiporter NhaA [Bacteroidales bacterium]|nr:Na+/H+ antiporter NhaA [Bacteroidales bacterium]MBQ3916556.1 Na+/H+ antiporter NhaA [Bacteroidales bacterium]MBQ3996448.1 Na+/H+ antiporter NhaA [Bacteroidales bacterium]MBR6362799.1 Na+/H+ antiporter NhaA [Bacteroidales bacterium]MEE3463032.1 Na+/H+ antiporter NhaA [Candidatus Cryptobacteroides sp.]
MRLIPIYAWNKSIYNFNQRNRRFVKQPWAQGVILLACVVIAMLLANLPATKHIYHSILETSLSINVAPPEGGGFVFPTGMTVEKFINDILMVIFFFTVGLEIKREVAYGELSTPKKAIMPIIAAFGGVVMPAVIYTLVNNGTAASSGWGIPTATDIAFAVGILSILGDKVPVSLKVFLTALAIADDLIAILVVAIFYGGSINLGLLGIALLLIVLILIMNKLGEKRAWYYFIPAIAVWVLFYYSGIHATMSGVVMAFLIPSKPRYTKEYYFNKRDYYRHKLVELDVIHDESGWPNGPQRHVLRTLSRTSKNCIGLSDRLEHNLGKWVNFLIMPIFALANAGVEIPDVSYFNVFQFSPELGGVSMGIFLGLLIGKPLGITLASWIAVKTKVGAMPEKGTWKMLFAVACLGGIGFTMSIFVDTLSFGEQTPEITAQLRDMGKVAVLMGSLFAGLLGSTLINIVHGIEKK